MQHILLNDVDFKFIHKRQQRKSIVFSLRDSKTILIKTPRDVPMNAVRCILQKHTAWICRKSQLLSQELPKNKLLYLGKSYPLRFDTAAASACRCPGYWQDGGLYLCAANAQAGQPVLQEWYRQQAAAYLKRRVPYWAQRLQVDFRSLTVRDQKSRWGSCSSQQRLNFNWRIILAPPAVIDYLIIHECAHLREMNHSAAFWQIVAQFDKDFKQHSSWLKKQGIPIFHAFRKN